MHRGRPRHSPLVAGGVASPFGAVDKPDGDPTASGRAIHGLSYPEGESVNGMTDSDSIERSEYRHCDAVVGRS
ncbi:hypothetical protein PybrP1_002259 [[Pythium] brassicae (nom. inval.)]|nr:hypothetical protein PybrP1_002259 [[Pythium] brassicae (nom. inval.)]